MDHGGSIVHCSHSRWRSPKLYSAQFAHKEMKFLARDVMLRVRGDLWSTTCLKIPVETGCDNVYLDTARTVHERLHSSVTRYVQVMGTPSSVPQMTPCHSYGRISWTKLCFWPFKVGASTKIQAGDGFCQREVALN